MLNLGKPLLSPDDLAALRTIVRSTYNAKGGPLTGIEVGPWLGRSTLTILAPDLPMTDAVPLEDELWELGASEFTDLASLQSRVEQVLSRFPADANVRVPFVSLKQYLVRFFSYRVRDRREYFSTLNVFDTWKGIASEAACFPESDPLAIFRENIRKAGFAGVVRVFQGESAPAGRHLHEPVDFVFVDGDHEYEGVVRDLFAFRHCLTPATVLCGHDFNWSERWSGVSLAVRNFIQSYKVVADVWVATPQGVEHLRSLPAFEHFADEVRAENERQNRRYDDPTYRQRFT